MKPQIFIVLAVILAFMSGLALGVRDRGCRPDRELDRACALAAGNARSTLPWLAPGSSRREAGLLLLSRDAAWAPVCARDRAAGSKLRLEIDAAQATPDAGGAAELGARLAALLERR